ncbi:late blight resistance homolog R1A-3 [Olea europaea subsp. europaea]|uniref:Late blight resistance homolog R1A-3 n=1 Tax=Olea europaea subsp. europaea TaxID=158383 RepID=A0A8S0PQL0_OLEEU|nr:late blight resistance homolog R1A-3 [Olea europaea subsp. europaea]
MSKITNPHHNELVVFIKFLLQILEETESLETESIVSVKLSIKILETELRFLITFLGDTPMSHPAETENMLTDMESLVNEVGNFLFSFLFTWNDPVMMTGVLDLSISDLLSKFELLKTKIKEHCITVFKLPSIMTPKTRVVSVFIVDTLLDDLNNLMNHRAYTIDGVQDQIITLHEELMLLTSSIEDVVSVSQTKTKVEEIVMGIVDIAYEIDYVINSFPPVWYLTLRLPQFMESSRLSRIAIKEMQKNIDVGIPEAIKYPSEQELPPPNSEDIFVGFKNEETKIVGQLVGGLNKLQIVTIFGMPGLGKTSLAKKLYNNESIVYHFDKRAWCVVSQTYQTTNMLIELLRSTSHINKEKIKKMDEESLVEELYKSLKGRRYLIVMDDIWDTEPWNDLKRYFPDDSTGSRILFTTQHKEVGVQASPNSVINKLPFMSEAEFWELLQRKVFEKENCPPELLDIGKQVAKNCLGLPLAVVVIAAVLANMEKKVYLWQGIVGSLNSLIYEDSNNCIQILELSYKHLPAHLKPCFLYFGVFDAYKKIPVRKLISLWIAEGFIKKEANRHPEDVAKGYLMDLIDRSLVLVVEKRSDGGVKTCNIHDLLHGMCLRIAKVQKLSEGDGKTCWRTCVLLVRPQGLGLVTLGLGILLSN